ncbi:MAG: cell division protein SepF [Clostridia bacterium]|nr:cell division protein SepF [Clostridia bacterium]
MGLFDKFKSMIVPEPDPYSEERFYTEPLEEEEAPPTRQPVEAEVDISGTDASTSVELKVVKPENYASVIEIADHLLNHHTVVLNLEATNKEVAKRLIDFLAGVAYSIDGQLKNVSNNTYIITPRNVDVADARVKNPAAPQTAPAQNTAPATGLTSDTLF